MESIKNKTDYFRTIILFYEVNQLKNSHFAILKANCCLFKSKKVYLRQIPNGFYESKIYLFVFHLFNATRLREQFQIFPTGGRKQVAQYRTPIP